MRYLELYGGYRNCSRYRPSVHLAMDTYCGKPLWQTYATRSHRLSSCWQRLVALKHYLLQLHRKVSTGPERFSSSFSEASFQSLGHHVFKLFTLSRTVHDCLAIKSAATHLDSAAKAVVTASHRTYSVLVSTHYGIQLNRSVNVHA